MSWVRIWVVLSALLSLTLTAKLITLKIHSTYKVFSAFLIFQVVSGWFTIIEKFTSLDKVLDYRVTWLLMRLGSWVLTIWIVYALLRDILKNLPGILRFSRRFLNIVFPLALVLALITAAPEYAASGAAKQTAPIDYAVMVALILERLVTTIALLVLLLMLAFILWFPVTMPRNLAVFSIGLSVYFTAKSALILFHHFFPHENNAFMDNGVTLIFCICLVYWIIFLNRKDEQAPVTVGHSWRSSRQSELLGDLDHINAALVRASRR
jgi:hypothetical protein